MAVNTLPEGEASNPSHLEAVTQKENVARSPVGMRRFNGSHHREKTHCVHGHPFDEENTYWTTKGARMCRTCRREAGRKKHPRLSN